MKLALVYAVNKSTKCDDVSVIKYQQVVKCQIEFPFTFSIGLVCHDNTSSVELLNFNFFLKRKQRI